MTGGHELKNEVISLNTKKALAASLKKIMQQKPFSKITISEIIRDCGLNRNTFYYHFEDIYALLHWMFEEEAIDVVKHFDLLFDYKDAIRFIVGYIEANNHIISCAYDSIGHDELKRFFYHDFIGIVSSVIDRAEQESAERLEPEFKAFIAQFYTEAISGTLVDWLKNNRVTTREKMIEYLCVVIENGLRQFHIPAD